MLLEEMAENARADEPLKGNIPKQDFDEVCHRAQKEVELGMLTVQGSCRFI